MTAGPPSGRNRSGCVLITGFGRFPGAAFNPSAVIARQLARSRRPGLADVRLVGHVFPTSYAAVDRELRVLLSRYRPDVLLMFGVAPRSNAIRIETIARNIVARFPDATRFSPAGRAIVTGGAGPMRSRIPARRMLRALRERAPSSVLSRNAGRYVCNYLYWRALEAVSQPGGPEFAAFVHVPPVRASGRRRMTGRSPTLPALVEAAQQILMTLVSSSRRNSASQSMPQRL